MTVSTYPRRTGIASESGKIYDVTAYGATANAKSVTDATMTSRTGAGTVTVTSATAAFVSGDVGKICAINARVSNTTTARGYIYSVESATSITVWVYATVSTIASGGSFVWGTDSNSAIQSAVTDASSSGGSVYFPSGAYVTSGTYELTNGASFIGDGHSRADVYGPVTKGGSILISCSAWSSGTPFVNVNGKGGSIRDISIDANQRLDYCVQLSQTQCSVINALIAKGTVVGLYITAGSSNVTKSHIYNQFLGYPIQATGDTIIDGCYVFGGGSTKATIYLVNPVDDFQIVGNHIYRGGWGETLSNVDGPNLHVLQNSTTDSSGGLISKNVFDTALGPQIRIQITNSSASLPLRALSIADNLFYQPQSAWTDNTYPCIKVESGSAGTNHVYIRGLSISGNVAKGLWSPARSYTAFVEFSLLATYGHVIGCSIVGNTADNCNALYAGGYTPDYTAGNCTIAGVGTVVAVA